MEVNNYTYVYRRYICPCLFFSCTLIYQQSYRAPVVVRGREEQSPSLAQGLAEPSAAAGLLPGRLHRQHQVLT